MEFLNSELPVKQVEFINALEYLLLCQQDGLCYVLNHETYRESNESRNLDRSYRKINVGVGFSKISLMEYEQFFLVSYPSTKSVAFY